MKRILLISFMLLSALITNAWAQDRTVSGKVTDEAGEAIPGVNIVLSGTTTGTTSDIDGNWKLTVPSEGGKLIFSFIGMATQSVDIGSRSVIDISMAADATELQEVLVVAYGESSKKSLIGAVGAMDASAIENQQITSVTQALQGNVAGVNVINSSGQPGANPTIRIRGVGSIDSSNDPLIVVDGAVYSSNLNTINPDDIESMSVLKDASAAALYGSRAGNGVILITTKTGKVGKPVINFSVQTGVSDRARKDYAFVSARDAVRMEWEALRNDGVDNGEADPGQYASDNLLFRIGYNPFGTGSDEMVDASGNFVTENTVWDTDWEDAIFTNQASRTDYTLGISGGTEDVKYYIGGSYLNQDGMVNKSDFERWSGRLNLDAQLNDWLSIGLRQGITYSEQNNPPQSGNAYANNVQWIRTVSSIYPVYRRDPQGEFILDAAGNKIYDTGDNGIGVNTERPVLSPANPVGQTILNESLAKRFISTTNVYAAIDFLEDFTFRTSYTYNKYLFDDFDYTNKLFGSARTVGGRINRDKDITTEWTLTNSLNWNKDINGDHNIDVLLLQEAYNLTIERLDAGKTGVPFDGLYELNSAATPETLGGSTDQERIASLMGRVKYSYQGKYLASASFRQDQSSRFAPEHRKGNFYSVSAGWLISEESFLSGTSFINLLKLRASYGELGNSKVLDSDGDPFYFPYLNVFQTGWDQPGTGEPGVYTAGLSNYQISWEKVATTNIGIDFEVLDGRIDGSVDAYQAVTKDLITGLSTVMSRGVVGGAITQNIGNVTNSGIELTLNGDVIRTADLNWNLGFNIAWEKNEITDFPEGERINGSKKLEEGRSIYDFWIREWAGVNPDNGRPMWYMDEEDADGNPTGNRVTTENYDDADRYFVGSALPTARGGVTSRLTWKGIDFSFLVNFQIGGKVIDYDYADLMHGGRRPGQQYSADILDRWQQAGDITDVPRLSTDDRGSSRSTRFLFDGTYARLRNVTLGYTLPSNIMEGTGIIRSCRIYVAADNQLTFFGREGLDPEQNIQGTTDNRSSTLKTISGGLQLQF